MSEHSFQEEEFDTSLNGGTLLRILGLTRPHWKSVAGFVAAIGGVAILRSLLELPQYAVD